MYLSAKFSAITTILYAFTLPQPIIAVAVGILLYSYYSNK